MLRLWSDFGFTTLAATHHLSGELRSDYQDRVEQAVDAVWPVLQESGLQVIIGFEIMLDPRVPQRLQHDQRLSLGGSKAVLVEVPFLSWPNYTEEVIFAMQLAGYRPILAHPERYDAVQENLPLATSLASRGVVLQLTYASLAGVLGAAAKRTAERLIDQDLPIILASDAHGPGQRLQAVPDGLRRAEQLVGRDRLRQMTTDAPAALLGDLDLPETANIEAVTGKPSRLRRILHG